MSDELARVLKGVRPGFKVKGQVYMLVDLSARNPGGRTSLSGLAKNLVVHPQRLLGAILSRNKHVRAVNREAADALCLEECTLPGMRDEDRPDYSFFEMRANLLDQASTTRNFGNRGKLDPRYYGWGIAADVTIAVPLSKGMVDVIERDRRWEAIKVEVEGFEKKLDDFADRVIALRDALSDLCAVGRRGMPEVGMLMGLSQYCDLLLDQQGNPLPGEDPLADFQDFLQRSAIPLFMDKIVRNPIDLAPDAARRRDTHALHLMRALDDPEFDEGAKLVTDNHDVVPHELLDKISHFFNAASDLLALTDQSEEFANKHALPMIEDVASLESKEYDDTIDDFKEPGLMEAMRNGWKTVLTKRKTIYSTVIGISSGIIGSASNLEGPRSIVVAVMMQYQGFLFRRGIKNFRINAALLDRATNNFYKHFGDLDGRRLEAFRKTVAEAMFAEKPKLDIQKLAEKSGFDVTRGPLRGVGARRAIFVLALATGAVAAAVNVDDEEKAYLALGSALGTVGVAGLDLPKVAALMERRWALQAPRIAARLAGAVTVAGIFSGIIMVIEACEQGDNWGVTEGLLGAAGSAASLGGWVWSMMSSAGAFALMPSVVMTAGSVLVVVGIGVGLWRTFAVTQPRDIVVSTLEHFQDESSRASVSGLEPTVETLIAMADQTNFRPIQAKYEPALRAFGYSDEIIQVFRGLS